MSDPVCSAPGSIITVTIVIVNDSSGMTLVYLRQFTAGHTRTFSLSIIQYKWRYKLLSIAPPNEIIPQNILFCSKSAFLGGTSCHYKMLRKPGA